MTSTSQRKLFHQPPKVIERYVRLRVRVLAKSLALRFARRVSRPRLKWGERKRRRALASAFDEVVRQAAKSRQHNFEASTVVFNLALFFLIAERDVQALKIDALTHPDAWQRSLCARVILLTIHELDMYGQSRRKQAQASYG